MHLVQKGEAAMAIFDETYRVIAVESQCLTVQGNVSGEVLTIVNTAKECPLTQEEFPVGQLIALTDPSASPVN
jgi:glutathione peroxidase-family protein